MIRVIEKPHQGATKQPKDQDGNPLMHKEAREAGPWVLKEYYRQLDPEDLRDTLESPGRMCAAEKYALTYAGSEIAATISIYMRDQEHAAVRDRLLRMNLTYDKEGTMPLRFERFTSTYVELAHKWGNDKTERIVARAIIQQKLDDTRDNPSWRTAVFEVTYKHQQAFGTVTTAKIPIFQMPKRTATNHYGKFQEKNFQKRATRHSRPAKRPGGHGFGSG